MGRIIMAPGTVIGTEGDWTRVVAPHTLDGVPEAAVFQHGAKQLAAIRSRELGRWHLSVSHRARIPTWDELGYARDCLLPADVWCMVAHPPREYWLNYDSRVLHLWQFDDPVLIAQFKMEGQVARVGGYNIPDSGV